MANREALRELQTRLASRLQAARSEGVSVAWLAVRARGTNFLFPLSQSGEIFPMANLQPVPYVLPWFRGVVNIRGGLYGVVDLASFVSGAAATPVPVSVESSVVTLNSAMEVNCALQVDALLGLRGSDGFASSSPAEAGSPAFFGTRFVDSVGDVWQEINLRALAQDPHFLSIRA
jgi:twitching motility protein PilI